MSLSGSSGCASFKLAAVCRRSWNRRPVLSTLGGRRLLPSGRADGRVRAGPGIFRELGYIPGLNLNDARPQLTISCWNWSAGGTAVCWQASVRWSAYTGVDVHFTAG